MNFFPTSTNRQSLISEEGNKGPESPSIKIKKTSITKGAWKDNAEALNTQQSTAVIAGKRKSACSKSSEEVFQNKRTVKSTDIANINNTIEQIGKFVSENRFNELEDSAFIDMSLQLIENNRFDILEQIPVEAFAGRKLCNYNSSNLKYRCTMLYRAIMLGHEKCVGVLINKAPEILGATDCYSILVARYGLLECLRLFSKKNVTLVPHLIIAIWDKKLFTLQQSMVI